jgi:hypothetical protein
LWIAELNDEARNGAMNALAVVEATLHQRDDVRDGLRRVVRERLERERPSARFDDDHRTDTLRSRQAACATEDGHEKDGPRRCSNQGPRLRSRQGRGVHTDERLTPTFGHIDFSPQA